MMFGIRLLNSSHADRRCTGARLPRRRRPVPAPPPRHHHRRTGESNGAGNPGMPLFRLPLNRYPHSRQLGPAGEMLEQTEGQQQLTRQVDLILIASFHRRLCGRTGVRGTRLGAERVSAFAVIGAALITSPRNTARQWFCSGGLGEKSFLVLHSGRQRSSPTESYWLTRSSAPGEDVSGGGAEAVRPVDSEPARFGKLRRLTGVIILGSVPAVGITSGELHRRRARRAEEPVL